MRTEADRENRERRNEIQRLERRYLQKEESLERKMESLEKKEEALAKKEQELFIKIDSLMNFYRSKQLNWNAFPV